MAKAGFIWNENVSLPRFSKYQSLKKILRIILKITVEKNHRYKIEVNGIYADVGYVQSRKLILKN